METMTSTLRGGAWLLEASDPATIVTPEKLSEEQRLIGQTAEEFVAKEVLPQLDRLDVNGGAIALGHPLGCTGAKLTTTLLYEMRRRSARYGLVTMCVGGGMGAAAIFERP